LREPIQFYAFAATLSLTTIPLTTSGSYDQNFLKKISIQSSGGKEVIKINFEIHFDLCAQSVDYHNDRYWENGKTTFLIPRQLAGGCIFHLISHCRLPTGCSERILIVSGGAPVLLTKTW